MWRSYCIIFLLLFVYGDANKLHNEHPRHVSVPAFSRCPSKCACLKRTVRCMRLDLTEVPKTPTQTTVLDLRFNKIKEVRPGTLRNNTHIISLLLNNNLLNSLKYGSFDGLLRVQNLYLHDNRIQYIEPNVFQGMNTLERLYLHNNQLEELKYGTFSDLPSLNRLYLYHNNLKRIPQGTFDNLPNLMSLRLDHNSLVCDCSMLWLSEMLKEKYLEGSASCKYPTEMTGKSLKEMSSRDFHCSPLEIMESPQDIQVSWGQNASFKCKVQDPEASIHWMKEDRMLTPDENKYKIIDNGSLVIQNTEESDGGYYECIAENVEGEVAKSKPAKMTVLKPEASNIIYDTPRFTVVPENIFVDPGQPLVTMNCQSVGNPTPIIKWAKNGVRIPPSEKYSYGDDGSLSLRNIDPTDHGSYQCEAVNSNGRITAEASIIVKAAPIFTIQPESSYPPPGGTVRLECVASGTPAPLITWFKDDVEIISEGRTTVSEDGTLVLIREVREEDGGLYVCEASNEMGMREVSAEVKVERAANEPAQLVYKPYNIEAIVGSTIEMPCRATGDPKPGITWQKDGSSMQRTGRFKVSLAGNLYIYKVSPEDQGRYECIAINDYGRDSASGYITVKPLQKPTDVTIGDQYVRVAFEEATEEVDRAINRTIDNLINNKTHNPRDIFRLIRYPDAPARELARAAEVYERTLTNIRKYVENGNMMINSVKDFDYKEILSEEHLELIEKLSGCTTHRLKKNCSDMCYHSKYRSIDGTCNNLQHPMWGASLTGFRRILKPQYEDGLTKPIGWTKDRKYYGYPKPSSRLVSLTLITTKKITHDPEITHMVMQWGQFLDHDLDHSLPSVTSESWEGIDCKKTCDYAAPCYPMDVPPNDPRVKNRRCIDFTRTSSICGSGTTSIFFDAIQPREQINQLTSYIDASQVYGFSDELARNLRDLNTNAGRLREGPIFPERKALLPYAENQGVDCRRNLTESTLNCFVAGDIRVNEQVGLLAMHTVWMREHNKIAKELKLLNPHWDTDRLYQESRKIVGAAMQHVTYQHWLPIILGPKGMDTLGTYQGYNPNVNPTISNVFATAALRFGHTLINPVLERLDWDFQPIREGHLPLSKAFFSPWRVVEEGGIDPLLRGLFTAAAKVKRPEENLNSELTETLFQAAHAVALDLAALNVHRGRDHAIPGYLEFRKFCNMSEVHSFDDLKRDISDRNVRRKMQKLYGHPGNVDVFVGGILEDQKDGAKIGPLFQCLLIEQFKRLRDGDRFFYENPSVFKPEQLSQIKQYTLARVLCDNGDNITKVSKDVFRLPELQGGYSDCEAVPRVDLSFWFECFADCPNARRSDECENSARIRRQIDQKEIRSFIHRNLKRRVSVLERNVKVLRNNMRRYDRALEQMRRHNFTG
ncbi:unnamed protein product [Phaedon cochleariae]|uniref:Ig-like domain-containing protein n=1 Tax=Phaedon cochleariae TaxID=80249 RepID=A0A9N9SH79_PHACE|nr:unnamed protein product [Phaedon cochleariae]